MHETAPISARAVDCEPLHDEQAGKGWKPDNPVTIPIDSAQTPHEQRIGNQDFILRSKRQIATGAHRSGESSNIEAKVAFVRESAAGCVENHRAMEGVHASQVFEKGTFMLLHGESASESTEDPGAPTAEAWHSEWYEVNDRLREYARHRAALDAAEAYDLIRAEQLKIHFFCGCATMYEYLERVLGYGPHAARERMRVARSLAKLPQTTAALARGELKYSAVRELTRVATPETEDQWLKAAEGMTAGQVERLVVGHQSGDQPHDPTHPDLRPRVVRIELPPEVYALWRQARSVVATERGAEISDADFVESLCRAVIAPGSGAEGPAHQIAYQQCPDCRRATQNGAGREIDIAPEAFERAACDARDIGSLDAPVPQRATTTVTPRMREQVFARDHHSCTVPGCRSARNLDIHHIIPQAHGGKHELSNLSLLCSGHHAALHDGLLELRGRAPWEIEVRWVYGPPLPVGLTPEARQAMIRDRIATICEQVSASLGPAAALAGERPSWDESPAAVP